MTKAQEYALKLSDVAGRLNEIGLLEGDAYGEEVRAEEVKLHEESREVRTRYTSALVAEGEDEHLKGAQFGASGTSEDRAYRELVTKADVGEIFEAVVEKRATVGAASELQQHHKLTSHQVPLDALRDQAAEEHRDVATVPTNVETGQQPTIPPVFARGDMAYLGVSQPSVPVGDAVFPILTSRPMVRGPFTGSDEANETNATFEGDLLKPSRVQAAFRYRRTDAARFAGMGESLRSALTEGLGEALDKEGVSGTNGLLTSTNLPNHNVSALTTFALYMSQFIYGRVDGRYATDAAMLRTVVGAPTYAHMGSVYRANNVDDPAAQIINARTGGVRVSAHVPGVSSNKQNTIIRLGSRMDLVQPLWEGVSLILSEADEALVKKGEILITAVLIHATKVIRSDGFYKQETKHA